MKKGLKSTTHLNLKEKAPQQKCHRCLFFALVFEDSRSNSGEKLIILLNYDYHIRAIFWDTESAELIAIGYVAVQHEGQDELMIEDDWFTIKLYENPITLEIDADGEMDGIVDKNWEILFKSKNKPSWLDEDEDLQI